MIGSLDKLFTGEPFFADSSQLRTTQIARTVRNILVDDCPEAWNHSQPPAEHRHNIDNIAAETLQAFEADFVRWRVARENEQQTCAQAVWTWLNAIRTGSVKERIAYAPIQSLFLYVARSLQRLRHHHQLDLDHGSLVLPYRKVDFELPGSDDSTKPDVVLCLREFNARVELQDHAHYRDSFLLVEIKSKEADIPGAISQLGKYALHILRNQHDARYPIGLVVCGTIAKVVVFSMDVIWASDGADLSTAPGRARLIRQIAEWTWCSQDRRGRDLTITHHIQPAPAQQPAPYTRGQAVRFPAAQRANTHAARELGIPTIIYELNIDGTSYFSNEVVQIADRLTGMHRRCFLASRSIDTVANPSHTIIDYWGVCGHDEAATIMHINNHFQQGANPRDVLPRPLTAIVVQQRNDHGEWVADDVATTFGALTEVAGLANNWLADNNRVHRRMLFEFPWRPISEATDQLSAVIAISHAWASYSAIHGELGFVCASIRTDSILYYEANGITHGMFLGVGEAIDMRTITQRQPPLEEGPMAMRAIRPSENPEAPPTFVDDAESLFYLVCSLGTFGINQAQRAVFVEDPSILIMLWNKGAAVTSARLKRAYLSNEMVLTENILFFMRPGPLHDLALDMYRVLFLHPGTFGTTRINNAQLAAMRDDGIAAALRALPVIDGRRDPLALRLQFVVEIIRNLLNILDQHRGVLAGLGAGAGAGAGA